MDGVKSVKRLFLGVSVFAFVLLLVVGCSNPISLPSSKSDKKQKTNTKSGSQKNQSQTAQVGYEPVGKVLVTRNDASLPDGCKPRQVAGLITNSFAAFNKGDQGRLAHFFASEGLPGPGLFGAGAGKGDASFATTSRDDLLKDFARRHEHKERMRLLEVDVEKRNQSSAAIAYNLTRKADDIGPNLGGPKNIAVGKGVINCREQRFLVWNMAMAGTRDLDKNGLPHSLCPEPSNRKSAKAAIACARKSE